MRFFLTILLTVLLLDISQPRAQESTFSGTPEPATLDTNATPHSDIYQRRLVYREEALKMDDLMDERRENFAAPRRAALKQYKADVEALNATRSSKNQ